MQCVCQPTRQVSVSLILRSQLEDGQQELLSREEQQAILDGAEERGSHVADEGDEWLHVACVRQTLGLGQRSVELLQHFLHVHLPY